MSFAPFESFREFLREVNPTVDDETAQVAYRILDDFLRRWTDGASDQPAAAHKETWPLDRDECARLGAADNSSQPPLVRPDQHFIDCEFLRGGVCNCGAADNSPASEPQQPTPPRTG